MKENSEIFYNKYKPIYNHIANPEYKERQTDGDCIGSPMWFETYGKELEYVKYMDEDFIWTLIEVDGNQYIVQGMHYVNRMGYLIATEPYIRGEEREFLDWIDEEEV